MATPIQQTNASNQTAAPADAAKGAEAAQHAASPTVVESQQLAKEERKREAFKALRGLAPDYALWRDFHYEYERDRLAIDLINGSPLLREWVDDPAATAGDLDALAGADERDWLVERDPFLLYR